jgi:hypothetical protein
VATTGVATIEMRRTASEAEPPVITEERPTVPDPKAEVDTGFLPSSTVTFRDYGGPPLCRRAVQQRQRRVDGGVARERFPG